MLCGRSEQTGEESDGESANSLSGKKLRRKELMFVDLVCVVASGSSQTGVCVCVQRRKALVKLSFWLARSSW